MNGRILAVTGPTASGKSGIAVILAKKLGGEIISLDSMQIYRGMDIGTAKPTRAEMQGVPHHLIDIADPCDRYSAADYVKDASAAVSLIRGRGHLPVFCGGTGLYLDALIRGGYPDEKRDEGFREELAAQAQADGGRELYSRLCALDPEAARAIHPNNVKRVIRALEIIHLSGMTKTERDRKRDERTGLCNVTVLCLCRHSRDEMRRRIDARVDDMLAAGLAEEARRLYDSGVLTAQTTAAQAIGYKEFIPFFEGRETVAEAAEKIKTATKQYAKRQMTWFCSRDYITRLWCDSEDGTEKGTDATVSEALSLFGEE